MIYCIGHNIISPLGLTSDENFNAVMTGKTALQRYDSLFGMPEACFVSVFPQDSAFRKESIDGLTFLERLMIASVEDANKSAGVDLSAKDTIFIISTTKGNVEYLSDNEDNRIYLWHTAKQVSEHFGNKNKPLVISNACISGVAAQVDALRLLNEKLYKNAVIVGGDVLSKFIISGFQSFKALSVNRCKPFDKDRQGLNLGEAVATIIYTNQPSGKSCFTLVNGAIRNDARHISAPSIEAEGLYNTLKETLHNIDLEDIAFVNAHGTATIYNDEMEALALNRMGMQKIPVNSLKAFFGHTLGAAGVLETIISALALHKELILKSENCDNADAKHEIHPVKETVKTDKKAFVKMVSGFGGTNAALLNCDCNDELNCDCLLDYDRNDDVGIVGSATFDGRLLKVNGKEVVIKNFGDNILTNIYKTADISYPKFYKMDRLSKVGFLVAELMLRDCGIDYETPKKDFAIALFNRSASSDDDLAYYQSIKDKDNYFPSPSVFVYTLPNIVSSEIAIRNKFLGESSFYITENISQEEIIRQVRLIINSESVSYVLCGWVECFKENINVKMMLVGKGKSSEIMFNEENITQLWKN